MSFVLGICNDETSSACILSEKALVAAASEERFTRVKADTSWPTKSIEFCLDQAGVAAEQRHESNDNVASGSNTSSLVPAVPGRY